MSLPQCIEDVHNMRALKGRGPGIKKAQIQNSQQNEFKRGRGSGAPARWVQGVQQAGLRGPAVQVGVGCRRPFRGV